MNNIDPTGLFTQPIPPAICGTFSCVYQVTCMFECDGPPGAVAGAYNAVNAINNARAGAGSPLGAMIDASKKRVAGDLTSDCADALGTSAAKAIDKLANVAVSTGDLGKPVFISDPATGVATSGTSIAQWHGSNAAPGIYGTITFNTSVNWGDLNHQPVILDGRNSTVNLLQGYATYVDVKSVSAAQYIDAYMLHELAHAIGQVDPDNQSNMAHIYDQCISHQ